MYAIRPYVVAERQIRGPQGYWNTRWDEWVRIVFRVVVVRSDDVVLLLNTGPPTDLDFLNGQLAAVHGDRARLIAVTADPLGDVLAAEGLSATEVTHVVLTPLQLYTTGGIDRFPSARIHLAREGWTQLLTAREHPHDVRALSVTDPALRYLLWDAWDRLELVDGQQQAAEGVRLRWSGVHHRASLTVEVDTAAGTVAMTDSVFFRDNISMRRPPGLCESFEEFFALLDRCQQYAAVLPLYDPDPGFPHADLHLNEITDWRRT